MTGQYPARLGITDWIGAAEGSAWKRNTELLPAFYNHELPRDTTTLADAMFEATDQAVGLLLSLRSVNTYRTKS